MKVTLFLRRSLHGYSIENIAENLAKILPRDVNVQIYMSKYPNKGNINRFLSLMDAMRHQGDVNHVMGDTHFFTYVLRKKITVLTILDCEKMIGPDYGYFRKKIYKLFWFTFPKLRCKYITTISEDSRNKLFQYANIDKEKVRVIYPGFDPRFKVLRLGREEKGALLQNREQKKTVLHISAAMSNKNVSRLIEAIKGLDIKFIKVGELFKNDLALLKKYNIDYLQFINIETDLLAKIYNAVDCLVFPSLIEGFGLPVVEAQSSGCPVVCSNIPSLVEVSGEGAFFVEPLSIESIRESIRKVLYDDTLRSHIIQKGLGNVRRFEWSKIARQYYDLYKDVVRKTNHIE